MTGSPSGAACPAGAKVSPDRQANDSQSRQSRFCKVWGMDSFFPVVVSTVCSSRKAREMPRVASGRRPFQCARRRRVLAGCPCAERAPHGRRRTPPRPTESCDSADEVVNVEGSSRLAPRSTTLFARAMLSLSIFSGTAAAARRFERAWPGSKDGCSSSPGDRWRQCVVAPRIAAGCPCNGNDFPVGTSVSPSTRRIVMSWSMKFPT